MLISTLIFIAAAGQPGAAASDDITSPQQVDKKDTEILVIVEGKREEKEAVVGPRNCQ